MTTSEKFSLNDVLYGLVVPIIVGLIIIAFPIVISPGVSDIIPFPLDFATAEIILTFAIPMFMGLLWSKWAGGATGFLLGALFYLASAGYNYVYNILEYSYTSNMWSDVYQISFAVQGMLVGYIAGALNNGSFSFKRLLIASLTAGIAVGLLSFYLQARTPMVTDYPYVFFITMLPRILFAVVVPIFAKLFMWYGIMPGRHE